MKHLVAVVGECLSLNIGDQAIARALSTALGSAFEVKLVPFTKCRTPHHPGAASLSKPGRLRKVARNFSRIFPKIHRSRAAWYLLGGLKERKRFFADEIGGASIIVIGGGQLIKDNMALFCDHLALISMVARARHIPYMFWGVGVDQRMSWSSRIISRRAIKAAGSMTLRDHRSLTRLRKWFSPLPFSEVSPDAAFSLARVSNWKSVRDVTMAVNVMRVESMLGRAPDRKGLSPESIRNAWFSIVKHYIDIEANPVLFTTGTAEDLVEAQHLRERIRSCGGPLVDLVHPQSLEELLDFLTRAENVFAVRMHAGILSYISGGNVVCVNWDDKVKGVWSSVGEQRRVFDLDAVCGDGAPESIVRMFASLEPPDAETVDQLAKTVTASINSAVANSMKTSTV